MVEHSPQILAFEEKAPTTVIGSRLKLKAFVLPHPRFCSTGLLTTCFCLTCLASLIFIQLPSCSFCKSSASLVGRTENEEFEEGKKLSFMWRCALVQFTLLTHYIFGNKTVRLRICKCVVQGHDYSAHRGYLNFRTAYDWLIRSISFFFSLLSESRLLCVI